jgi:AAA+ superfamily predicted ATPase
MCDLDAQGCATYKVSSDILQNKPSVAALLRPRAPWLEVKNDSDAWYLNSLLVYAQSSFSSKKEKEIVLTTLALTLEAPLVRVEELCALASKSYGMKINCRLDTFFYNLSAPMKEQWYKAMGSILHISEQDARVWSRLLSAWMCSRLHFAPDKKDIRALATFVEHLPGPERRIAWQFLTFPFTDIAGQIPEEIFDFVGMIKDFDRYKAYIIEPTKGVLLEGPPGTGKTSLARAIAKAAEANFFSASASEFINKYVGTGADAIRGLFKRAADATREEGRYKKSIIFIDEIDSIGHRRTDSMHDESVRTINQLLALMDGFDQNGTIFILAATNRASTLDPALLRPGRFDQIIKLGLPNKASRDQIFMHYLEKVEKADRQIDTEKLAELTKGFAGANIKQVVKEAGRLALREGSATIATRHLEDAIAKDRVVRVG